MGAGPQTHRRSGPKGRGSECRSCADMAQQQPEMAGVESMGVSPPPPMATGTRRGRDGKDKGLDGNAIGTLLGYP